LIIQAVGVASLGEWRMYTQNSYSENLSGRYRGGSILHGIAPIGFTKEEECLDQLGDYKKEFCSVKLKRDFS
jgi:hypothetical protein